MLERETSREFSIRAAVLLGLVILTSCGYRWGFNADRPVFSVPYVVGDSDGSLTGEVIRALLHSGVCDVRQSGAAYQLQVSVIASEGQTIGYRRDPQEIQEHSQKNLVASEKRKTLAVTATVYHVESAKIVCGPLRIEAYGDFDYVDGDSIQDLVFMAPTGIEQVVLPFSLGQLESIDAAEEAAMRPIHAQLAKKLVDAVLAAW